jgi:hypothetical protein
MPQSGSYLGRARFHWRLLTRPLVLQDEALYGIARDHDAHTISQRCGMQVICVAQPERDPSALVL